MVWMRRLGWAVGGLLLLWLAAWLAVPPLVKWQAEEKLSEWLGRKVSVGDVGFRPWALQLTLADLEVAAAEPASEPQLRLARLAVDLDAQSLLRLAPVVESLRLEAPRLRLARTGEGRYDIDDVLLRLAPRPGSAPAATPQVALYNFELLDGEVLFDDGPAKRQHRVSGMRLVLPFVSTLPSQADASVEPRLAFTLDGAAYDSGLQAVPFARSRHAKLSLKVVDLDLANYVGYFPDSLPVRVQRGRIATEMELDWLAPEQGQASLSLRGKVGLSDLALTAADGAPLLAVARLALDLRDVQPLARKVALGALRVEGLELHLARDAHGALSLQRLLPAPAPPAASAAAPAASPGRPWQASLESLEIAGSRVLWNDAAVRPASAWVLDGLALSAQKMRLPDGEPMPYALQATLRPQADASATLAVVSIAGQAAPAHVTAGIDLSALSLAAVAPYVNAAARVRVAGTGSARGRLEWAVATAAQPARLALAFDQVALEELRIDDPARSPAGRGETVALQRLQLGGVGIDLTRQSIAIASARLQRPAVLVERSAAGAWNLMALAGPTPLAESERLLVRTAAEATWQLRIGELSLDDGRVRLVDAAPAPQRGGSPAETVRLGVDKLRVRLQGLALRGAQLVSPPMLQLGARITDEGEPAAGARPATIEWRGRIGLQPLLASGKVRIERFPVHAVQAYAPHELGLRLRRAEIGFVGDVSMQQADAAGMGGDAKGDVRVSDLRLDSRADAGPGAVAGEQELLAWQTLALDGVAVSLRPGAVPKVAIREATLSDFFARLVLTEEGRLNLQSVAPHAAVAASAPAPAALAASAAAAAATPAARLPLQLSLGGLRLAAGRIDYSDRFVKPSYSAALTELNGRIGAFDTARAEPATLQLGGRIAGSGQLDIVGRLNPGAVPRELDITAKATDLELAPLSTYSAKYAGYAIERGKMSVAVHYTIEPDGKLEASHQLVLNQLTFGDRVESPSATKLPVRLAVSLLKDRDGVIDINLPVSGTLDDPQFSLGPLIWKVIVNLIGKALTAPFALLAGGGGPDLSVVAFQAGTSVPTDAGRAALDKVAKALADRPALSMTLTGEADAVAEREAYQRAAFEARLVQEQRRGQPTPPGEASAAPSDAALAGADRARLVRDAYRQTDLPDKPRNLIGMQADIPAPEMEALLIRNVPVTAEVMRELALQRGLVARSALLGKGLASDRLFLGDPRLRAGGADEAGWTPQVRLTLVSR